MMFGALSGRVFVKLLVTLMSWGHSIYKLALVLGSSLIVSVCGSQNFRSGKFGCSLCPGYATKMNKDQRKASRLSDKRELQT